MSKTPYMPLFIGDYLRKTRRLKAAEHGAYLLILMALWDEGGKIPLDQDELKAIARVGRNWPAVWSKIERYFILSDGMISHSKIDEVLAETERKRQLYVEKGRKGGRKSAKKRKEIKEAEQTELKPGSSNQTKGLDSPLQGESPNRTETENSDHAAAPVRPARESGGAAGACSEAKGSPAKPSESQIAWKALRHDLTRAGVISIRGARELGAAIHGFDDRVFFVEKPPFDDGYWAAIERAAERSGYGFEIRPREEEPPKLKAIDGGRS